MEHEGKPTLLLSQRAYSLVKREIIDIIVRNTAKAIGSDIPEEDIMDIVDKMVLEDLIGFAVHTRRKHDYIPR